MRELLNFLRELAQNNNREWFNVNKDRYLAAKKCADKLCVRLLEQIATFDPRVEKLDVKDCTYRIYRDVRFSADKSPYKTHIGIFINPPRGKKSLTCGYYLHLEPDNCFVCGGTVCLPSNIIKAIRMSIVADITRYREIVEDPEFRALMPQVGNNMLKTAPKGFPKDWPWMEYLRPRDFLCMCRLSDKFVCSPDLVQQLVPYLKQAKRYNDFINETIEDYI